MYLLNKSALFTLLAALTLMACNPKTDTTTTNYSNGNFISLTLSNDTFPKLSKTVFTADSIIDTTQHTTVPVKLYIISNKDSIDYGTSMKYVKMNFRFYSSSRNVLSYYSTKDVPPVKLDTLLKGNEIFNLYNVSTIINPFKPFSSSAFITNTASDAQTAKKYTININIHKVQPESYQWFQKNQQVDNHNILSQKAVFFNGKIYYYRNDGSNAYLDTTTYGANVNSVTVSGLPVNSPLNDMTVHNGQLFLTRDNGNIYSSTDGVAWTKKTVDSFSFKSLIYSFGGKLWATIQSTDSKYRFANSTDGTIWIERGELPSNYPISDFASLSYISRNGTEKGIVVGGLDGNANLLKTNWSTEDGYKLINFAQENSTLDSLDLGASVISYDNKLLLFGAVKNSIIGNNHYYRVSTDEGLSWQKPNKNFNQLNQLYTTYNIDTYVRDTTIVTSYKARKYQSAVVDSKNRIYILGGKDNTTTYSDIWTGKLNRLSFKPIVK
jgi:Domain of unknown function (DUF6242)